MQDNNRKIMIFSGTTEGRELSEILEKNRIPHTVLVASDFGEMFQPVGEYTLVLSGKKDYDEIKKLIQQALVVVDATHPYATLVTENIRRAAKDTKTELIRILRDCGQAEASEDNETHDDCGTTKDMESAISFFDSPAQCALALEKEEGNILFTTGSKDLCALCASIKDKAKVFARVLPSAESISLCEDAGIRKDHIIAMFGPFNKELNLALVRQYNIGVLVTKDSGSNGGFQEKILACEETGAKVFCIKRPLKEEGVSVHEAFEMISKKVSPEMISDKSEAPQKRALTINIIGTGMGARQSLTIEANDALERSDVVFGAGRLLENIKDKRKYHEYRPIDILQRIEELIRTDEKLDQVTVLFSGDTGFFSGAAKLEEALSEWERKENLDLTVNRYPGISSVSYLSSKLLVSYSDAAIISLHGRNEEEDISEAVVRIVLNKKSFVLLSSLYDLAALSKELLRRDAYVTIHVGRNLSYDDESIRQMSLEEASKASGKALVTLYIENKAPEKRLLIPTISDSEFIRNRTPMTKELVRHEVVRLLELKEGDVLFDIGSGTGSIAIEAAALSPSLRVYSFEKDLEAIAVQRENIRKFEVMNVTIKEGTAPETLDGVETPDAVFIGGSGRRFKDIIVSLAQYHKKIRVVMSAVSLESTKEIFSLNEYEKVTDLDIFQLSVSRSEKAGEYNLMKSQNAVYIAAFTLDGDC